MTGNKPTAFVIDDDESIRKSLKWLIESVDIPVQTYPSSEAFLEDDTPKEFGCIITDVRMPGMGGLKLQEELKKHSIELPVIFLTGHGDVNMAVGAMKNGAFDFIQKPFNDQELLDTIQSALNFAGDLVQSEKRLHEIESLLSSLTDREREILELIVQGKPTKAIAGDLEISKKTVDFHRSNIMNKMNASTLAQLISMTVEANAKR